MGNLLAYSGIVTKVRAMHGNLLSDAHYQEIASLKSVVDIAAYLKGHPAYEQIFEPLDVTQMHRGDIEKLLSQSLYKDYSKIYQFASMGQRKFLKLYLKRYEVDLINYCFRITFNHYAQPFDLSYKKAFFDHYSDISIDNLIASRNIAELVDSLKDTEYYKPLKPLRDSNTASLFDYDLALNLYYFASVWRQKRKILNKAELDIFARESGAKIDLLNLQWIYRAKKYYRMQPADIYTLLIPIHYHIPKDMLKDMVEAASLDEFIGMASQTYYSKRFHQNLDQPFTIEQLYKDCLTYFYRVDKLRNPYSIAMINSYLFSKEQEIDKITNILECIRYGLPPRETLRYAGGEILK